MNNIKNLTELYAGSNKLTQTPNLDGMEQLQILSLTNNAFENLGNIGTLFALQELDISRNYLNNLDVLASCPNLSKLIISYNQYESLNGIEVCENLQYLDIRGTFIQDVSCLSELKQFNTIYVDDEFDRTQLDFMISNFRNGDLLTKKYLLEKQYNLK